jgi:hypothetical protein
LVASQHRHGILNRYLPDMDATPANGGFDSICHRRLILPSIARPLSVRSGNIPFRDYLAFMMPSFVTIVDFSTMPLDFFSKFFGKNSPMGGSRWSRPVPTVGWSMVPFSLDRDCTPRSRRSMVAERGQAWRGARPSARTDGFSRSLAGRGRVPTSYVALLAMCWLGLSGKTEAGKHSSRCNAVRHGLTAETVIGALEDAEDYKAFEAAITADYEAQSAVERELVLRLASLLWRLRRATIIETGLFEIQAEHLSDFRKRHQIFPASREMVYALFNTSSDHQAGSPDLENRIETNQTLCPALIQSQVVDVELARCFLRLCNLPNYALDRLSRYEAILWRQAGQILYALDNLDRNH